MYIKKEILCHINDIKPWDTIICCDGIERTVCSSNIKYSEFMGKSIFGDSWRLGTKLVIKIIMEEVI